MTDEPVAQDLHMAAHVPGGTEDGADDQDLDPDQDQDLDHEADPDHDHDLEPGHDNQDIDVDHDEEEEDEEDDDDEDDVEMEPEEVVEEEVADDDVVGLDVSTPVSACLVAPPYAAAAAATLSSLTTLSSFSPLTQMPLDSHLKTSFQLSALDDSAPTSSHLSSQSHPVSSSSSSSSSSASSSTSTIVPSTTLREDNTDAPPRPSPPPPLHARSPSQHQPQQPIQSHSSRSPPSSSSLTPPPPRSVPPGSSTTPLSQLHSSSGFVISPSLPASSSASASSSSSTSSLTVPSSNSPLALALAPAPAPVQRGLSPASSAPLAASPSLSVSAPSGTLSTTSPTASTAPVLVKSLSPSISSSSSSASAAVSTSSASSTSGPAPAAPAPASSVINEKKSKLSKHHHQQRRKKHSPTSERPIAPSGLPLDPSHWTVRQVLDYISRLGLVHLCERFEKNGVDGEQLLDLSKSDLQEDLEIEREDEIQRLLTAISHLRQYVQSDDADEIKQETKESQVVPPGPNILPNVPTISSSASSGPTQVTSLNSNGVNGHSNGSNNGVHSNDAENSINGNSIANGNSNNSIPAHANSNVPGDNNESIVMGSNGNNNGGSLLLPPPIITHHYHHRGRHRSKQSDHLKRKIPNDDFLKEDNLPDFLVGGTTKRPRHYTWIATIESWVLEHENNCSNYDPGSRQHHNDIDPSVCCVHLTGGSQYELNVIPDSNTCCGVTDSITLINSHTLGVVGSLPCPMTKFLAPLMKEKLVVLTGFIRVLVHPINGVPPFELSIGADLKRLSTLKSDETFGPHIRKLRKMLEYWPGEWIDSEYPANLGEILQMLS